MRRYLRSKGFTQDEIAKHLGMAPYLLSSKLRFKDNKKLNTVELYKICDYCGIDSCEFIKEYEQHFEYAKIR